SLYNYFSKLYVYHAVAKKAEGDILKAMGLRSSFFLREYRAAARQFPFRKTEMVIHLLREYDLKGKGVGYNSTGKPEGELLKEMTWRILHV
ncbi:MAG: DNA polymerase III subunit delta, partial [Bacteroidota bacterium]